MPLRLTKIDELTRPDHSFLEADDECFYLGEYNARKGYQFSETNKLIINLKKPVDRRSRPEWAYKRNAIESAGRQMRQGLDGLNPKWASILTLVPMPPSKIKTDPLYDDRLMAMLHVLREGVEVDIRELILQSRSTDAAHTAVRRQRIQQLKENYGFDESLAGPTPRAIGLIDDVITTGAHFKAAQGLLLERFPGIRIYGLFIARRVPDSADIP